MACFFHRTEYCLKKVAKEENKGQPKKALNVFKYLNFYSEYLNML